MPYWLKGYGDIGYLLNDESMMAEAKVWKEGDTVTLRVPMHLSVERWTGNHDSASVSYGPLTFSLEIGEEYVKVDGEKAALRDAKWRDDVDTEKWPAFEIHPTTPWNYGLVLADEPSKGFAIERQAWPADDFPFTLESAPIRLVTKGKQIPQWQLDRTGLCATLQASPVKSDQPVEGIRLVPMGAARLRVSAFPVIGDGTDAHAWKPPVMAKKLYAASASHCYEGDSRECRAWRSP